MPLVRVELRNEYGLGAPEMYREANKDEPKEILEGVAVAGLVGVLRQLGDLADFAAEVFHGLQEEVMITYSRSHKLMGRVQQIEAALVPVEKAVLAQRSHIHFAYTAATAPPALPTCKSSCLFLPNFHFRAACVGTLSALVKFHHSSSLKEKAIAGSNWHAPTQCERNHFLYSDMPQFILDSYEDCRGPPRFHLLDRFDPGGPGSCLKRYSDPTIFKKASIASGKASPEKVSKDKKGHKMKKRRSWPRNREVSRGASFSYHSGRMQFTQFNVGGHTSPCQPISTYDATLRSDLSEQSNLDWRNGSGDSKDDLRPSCSMQPKEQESRDFISSPQKSHGNDYLDHNFLKEKVADACNDIQINLTQEQGVCSSYSDTWGEKTATLKPAMQDHDGMTLEDDNDGNLESFFPRLDLETLGDNAVNLETVDKLDVQTSNQTSSAIHLDDFESEIDHFMDALNAIEPESETDVICMRRQDVDHFSKLEDKAAEEGLPELIKHNLECQTSNSESNILADSSLMKSGCGHKPIAVSPKSHSTACCSSGSVVAKDEYNMVSSVDKALLSAQRTGDSLNPGSPQSVSSSGNGEINDCTNVKSVSCRVSSNFRDDGSGMPIIGDTLSSQECEKPAPETSNVTSVTFWTNGGLLGLQPSKPPDCSVLNDLPQDHLSKKDGKISSSQQLILSDKDPQKPDKTDSFQNIEEGLNIDSSTCQEYQESSKSFRNKFWKISPANVDAKLGRTGDLLYLYDANSTGASVTASGSFLPVNSGFQAATKHPESTGSSSRMFELSNRLLATGSNKKLLHGGDENSRHASYQSANAFEEKNHQNVAYQTFSGRIKDLSEGESLMQSPSSSPALVHMKISVQPIDGFKTSKLKLKFLDGDTNDESSRDIFPSFQLVPEVSSTQHNVGSDSDDDTFCRSSHSLSDDCHSHQSESNSEQWETGRSANGKDPDLYDSLCRISLTESVSTVLENGRTCHGDIHENCGLQFPFVETSMQTSHSCHAFDLQSLETLNHSFQKELRNDTNSKDLVESEVATAPDPPPLPPVQWRGVKPHLDDTKYSCEVMPKASNYAFHLKHSESEISQQPKPAPLNHDEILETVNEQKSKLFGSQKSHGRREDNQGKNIDENDFLHQIRTKSFSLRPTVPAKPTVPSGGSSNVQVTAILEKANAIRQAVGSDDGDDDGSWSDT